MAAFMEFTNRWKEKRSKARKAKTKKQKARDKTTHQRRLAKAKKMRDNRWARLQV